MPVTAVTPGGSLIVSSGSISATHDAMSGVPPTLNLILRLGSVMTAHSVTSLPVPAVVGTAIIGGMRERIGLCTHPEAAKVPPGPAHGAPTAYRPQAVASLCAVLGGACVDQLDAGVCLDLVENDRLDI